MRSDLDLKITGGFSYLLMYLMDFYQTGVPSQRSDEVLVALISFLSSQENSYRKNSKIWDTSNNCHNCPKNRKV